MNRGLILLLAVCGLAGAGCGTESMLLGVGGTASILTATDNLCIPGQEVQLRARLQGGDMLRPMSGYIVRFYRDGRLISAAETDQHGVAEVGFTATEPGDYRFAAAAAPTGFAGAPPSPQELLLACRSPDAPIVIVDMDKTIVASGFHTVLIGDPEPMPNSAAVLTRLAATYTIVYLTHRPDYFGTKSKAWLVANNYPSGPVLMSSISGFMAGSGAYKSERLANLQASFKAIEIGIGDKISDAVAYHRSGLKSLLILDVPAGRRPADIEKLADNLSELPDDVQVVTDWHQMEQVLFEGASFPRQQAQRLLREEADAKTDKTESNDTGRSQ